jgi:sulfatase maturation enzyme AslB (radical SAM superfamily)
MSSPCKECLVLSCCRGKVLDTEKDIFILGDHCKLFYDYLEKFYSNTSEAFINLTNQKELLLKYMEVRDIFFN